MKGFVYFCFFIHVFLSSFSYGEQKDFCENPLTVKECLLPKSHPLYIDLKLIFTSPHQFDSPELWRSSGFDVNIRAHRGLMVGSHPYVNGYLFKKFENNVSNKKQLLNYMRRINGARNLSKFIYENDLKFIVVPKKWLFPLPKQFNDPNTNMETYLLVVEKINICGGELDKTGEVARHYRNIDLDVLKELCIVLFNFRGLDSVLHNMPFTDQGQIAFIDTERWRRKRKGFLMHIMPLLNVEKKAVVLGIINELQSQKK